MTYGCKIMVSLTLCGFLDHPVVLKIIIFMLRWRDGRRAKTTDPKFKLWEKFLLVATLTF